VKDAVRVRNGGNSKGVPDQVFGRHDSRERPALTQENNVTGNRWFLKHGSETCYAIGFRTKAKAMEYIKKDFVGGWRAGFVWRRPGDKFDRSIVNRKGNMPKL